MAEIFSFGYWVLRRRKSLDWTRAQLAARVGCAPETIKKIERDERRPSLQIAGLLANALEIPAEEREHFLQSARGEFPASRLPMAAQTLQPFPSPHHNLPLELTSFIGRQAEIAHVQDVLRHNRLVTLTGSGGVGKTRLSTEVAGRLLPEFPDGVWYVGLAPLADPDQVPQVVAAALGLREAYNRPVLETLIHFLSNRTLLLVLDNCEHLLDACAQLAHALLKKAPNLRIFASSREAFGITGEAAYRVPSLSAPEPNQVPSLEKLAEFEAVQLFAERARAALPDFSVDERNATAVAAICQRLDGIPLALELAAARLTLLTPQQLAGMLEHAFDLLTGGSRTALPRQQTLRASIDWSYNLLSAPERLLLQRLSVFSGSWTFDAAMKVCAGEGLGESGILDALTGLVAKSLAAAENSSAGEMRYRMLETIRQYAREKLANEKLANEKLAQEKLNDSGLEATIRDRHSQYFLELLRSQSKNLDLGTRTKEPEVIDENDNNIQAAIEWLIESAQVNTLCEMLDPLFRYYWSQGKFLKGERVFHQFANLLEKTGDGYARCARQILARDSVFHFLTNNFEQAGSGLETSLRAARDAGDAVEMAFCLRFLGNLARYRGEIARSRELYLECLDIYQKLGDQAGAAWTLIELGGAEEHLGDNEKARQFYEQSLAINQAPQNLEIKAICLDKLGAVSFYLGEYEKSAMYYSESLATFQEIGDSQGQANALGGISWNEWVRGGDSLVAAEQHMRQSLDILRETGYWIELVERIGLHGLILNSLGQYATCRQHCLEGLSFSQQFKNRTPSPLLLSVLAEAETRLLDFSRARTHLCQALTAGIELNKLPTLSITLYCCAELFLQQSGGMPDGDPQKNRLLREAYGLSAFIADSVITWKYYRDKARAMLAGLARQPVNLEQGQPWIGKPVTEVVERVLAFLKDEV